MVRLAGMGEWRVMSWEEGVCGLATAVAYACPLRRERHDIPRSRQDGEERILLIAAS